MSQIKRIITATLAAAASFSMMGFAANASASDDFYVGGALNARTTNNLKCIAGAKCEKASSGGKIYGGYTFNVTPVGNGMELKSSVEGSYYQLNNTKTGFSTVTGLKAGSGDTKGFGLAYKADLGNETFGVTGRLGTNFSKSSVDFASGSSFKDKRYTSLAVGLGARYSVTKNVDITADWDRIPARYSNNVKSVNNMFSIGAAVKF
jgi:opacity protein-like surface antigen